MSYYPRTPEEVADPSRWDAIDHERWDRVDRLFPGLMGTGMLNRPPVEVYLSDEQVERILGGVM